MKYLLSLILFLSVASITTGQDKHWEKIEQNFKEMPLSVRPNPLWFWNNTEVKHDELKTQMAGYKKAGYGGLSILPFGKLFQPKYLTDEYFDVYRTSIEEAKRTGLTLWIYDEYGFPSGTAGDVNGDGFGRFRHRYPEHTNKRLDKEEYTAEANTTFEKELPTSPLMAVVAMDTISLEIVNLKNNCNGEHLQWNVPKGNWKVMIFTCVDAGNTVMDYLSPEAAKLYINMTHEEYYKRFSEYFGNTIIGTFFDEPTMYYADGRTWTGDFNIKFEEKHGFDPALYYPALWYDIGEKTEEARNYLFGFRTELYAKGYIKEVNDWSKKHGLLATGHQDNEELLNPVGTSGDLMKCFKYLDIPGIDKIGGNRPAEKYYKVVSSAAHNWDHSLVMSETYGAMGNISWDEIFSIAMDQYVKGINLLIPHAVWYNTERVTFLPELSLRNPIYADSLNVLTDYLARLNSVMQNDARWIGDIAILYPVAAMQSGHYMDGPLGYYNGGVEIPDLDYIDVGLNLFDTLGHDFMYLHPEVLDEQCRIVDNKILLDNKIQYNNFSTLIVPASKTISLTNLEKIQQFANAGGKVIFTTLLPQKASLASDNAKVGSIVKELLKNKNVFFVENPSAENLKPVIDKCSENFGLKFTGTSLKNIHKIHKDKNIWFFANTDKDAKSVEIELNGKYDLEIWNPHTGATRSKLQVKHDGNTTKFKLDIVGINSLFVLEK